VVLTGDLAVLFVVGLAAVLWGANVVLARVEAWMDENA
jgi:hypothetical protein